jgi:hypothetical protein
VGGFHHIPQNIGLMITNGDLPLRICNFFQVHFLLAEKEEKIKMNETRERAKEIFALWLQHLTLFPKLAFELPHILFPTTRSVLRLKCPCLDQDK